jgi:hypothetical protein
MIKCLEWFGTTASLSGAYLVALQHFRLGYVCFTLGALSWIVASITRKNWAQLTMQAGFFGANILGLLTFFVV